MSFKNFPFAFALFWAASTAAADPISMATARQGSTTHSMALAISTVASDISGLDIRPLPFQSTSQALPSVNSGEIGFGLENAHALLQATSGTLVFEGLAQENVRVVARLLPLRMTIGVRADSDIQSVADLKGLRLPSGFGTTVTGETLIETLLSTAGLSYDDVVRIPVASFSAMAEAFVAGDLDAYIFIPGSPRDANISVQIGGIRPIDLDDSAETLAIVRGILPVASLYDVAATENLLDVVDTTTVLQYDYFIYTNADQSDADVIALLEALSGGKESMEEMVASMRWFYPENMYADVPMPYHAAAIAYFESKGLVPN